MMIPWWAHQGLATLSFVLTVLFVSSILRSPRPASSMMAWILVILAVPYAGIPLFLLLSGRKFKTRLERKAKIYEPPNGRPGSLSDGLSLIEKVLAASGVTEAKRNPKVALLASGATAYERILSLIHGAKRSIHITTFIFGNDPVGRAIVDALTEKAKQGVEVRLLVDSLGAVWVRHPSFKELKAAGGRIAYFMPVLHIPFKGRTNLRNHRKLMVIDRETAVLGGMNLAQEYLGPGQDSARWVDLAVEVQGGCVGDIERVFLKDWAYAEHETEAPAPPELVVPATGTRGQVVASGPDVVGDPLYDVLLSSIDEAKSRVRIVTPYFIPDESLTKALDLAIKRGVSVEVILPRRSNHRLADLARGSFVRQLQKSGVRFGFYPRMIHAKAVLVDRSLAVLGSANFDMRSLLLNYELGFLVHSGPLLGEIEEWIAGRSAETSGALPKAGYFRELAEGVGRVFGPLL